MRTEQKKLFPILNSMKLSSRESIYPVNENFEYYSMSRRGVCLSFVKYLYVKVILMWLEQTFPSHTFFFLLVILLLIRKSYIRKHRSNNEIQHSGIQQLRVRHQYEPIIRNLSQAY